MKRLCGLLFASIVLFGLNIPLLAQQSWVADLIGYCGTPEGANGVFVSGNYAYVADDYAGLRIIDVSNPTAPQEVGYYDTPGYATGVTVNGGNAYVADYTAGLRIIDVSNPSSPQEVGFYDTPGYAAGVTVSGGYAYVADGGYGLRIIDVNNSTSPQEVGYYDTPGSALGVTVNGGYAYVADGGYGLRIVDVNNPSSPQEVGYYDTPGSAQGVTVNGGYAYVADGDYGLRIIDVSNPLNPQEVGYFDTPGSAQGIYVSGDYSYVADGSAGLRIIDVNNPASPQEVGYYDTNLDWSNGVFVSGDYTYVADDGLYILKCHPCGTLTFSSSHLNFSCVNVDSTKELTLTLTNVGVGEVIVSDVYIYFSNSFNIASGGGSFVINPNQSHDITIRFTPYEVGAEKATLYIKSNTVSRLDSVELFGYGTHQQGLNVDLLGYLYPHGEVVPEDIFVKGNYAYVALGWGGGLRIVDISNPTKPKEVAYYQVQEYSYAYATFVQGNYAYVACLDSGLRTINVSNPYNPYEVGSFDAHVEDVYVNGNYAFLACSDGMRILNISNPGHPQEVGYYNTTYHARKILIKNGYVYLLESNSYNNSKLHILDISDLSNLQTVSLYETGNIIFDFYVADDFAYVTEVEFGGYNYQTLIFNVSDPSNPQQVSNLGIGGYMHVDSGYAYMILNNGLKVFDVNDPTNIQEVGHYNITAGPVFARNNYVYVSSYDGFYIFRFYPPGILNIHSAKLDFGTVRVGYSRQKSITITNISDYDVTVNNVNIRYTFMGFKLVNGEANFTLHPSQSRDVIVEFAPQSVGTKQAYLILESNAPSSPDTVQLNGIAVEQFNQIDLSFHQNPAFSQYVHFIPVCDPAPETVELKLTGASGSTSIPLDPINGGIYRGMHQFSVSGSYQVHLHATKGNIDTTLTRSINAQFMKGSTGGLLNAGSGIRLTMPSQALNGDMLVCAMPLLSSPCRDTLAILQIGPDVQLSREATLSYPLNIEGGVVFYQEDENGRWQKIPTFRSTDTQQAVGYVNHLGKIAVIRTDESLPLADRVELYQNYPNPFNPTTAIEYWLPAAEPVELVIYNVLGEKVRQLVSGHQESGLHRINWDGRDESGQPVASGVYLYQLKTPSLTRTRKMMLVR